MRRWTTLLTSVVSGMLLGTLSTCSTTYFSTRVFPVHGRYGKLPEE